jgi:hypothetical protein
VAATLWAAIHELWDAAPALGGASPAIRLFDDNTMSGNSEPGSFVLLEGLDEPEVYLTSAGNKLVTATFTCRWQAQGTTQRIAREACEAIRLPILAVFNNTVRPAIDGLRVLQFEPGSYRNRLEETMSTPERQVAEAELDYAVMLASTNGG